MATALERAYLSSPCPIVEISNTEWRKFCISRRIPYPSNQISGIFYHEMPQEMPRHLIVINRLLPVYKKIATFAHEIAHYRCYMNRCWCFDHPLQCEVHACIGSMRMCLLKGYQRSLKYLVRNICGQLLLNDKVASMVVSHAEWPHFLQITDQEGLFDHCCNLRSWELREAI